MAVACPVDLDTMRLRQEIRSIYARVATDPSSPGKVGLPETYRGARANEGSFFVQDDWELHPRLTLNAGLRWDYYGVPHNFRPGFDSTLYFGDPTVSAPAAVTT